MFLPQNPVIKPIKAISDIADVTEFGAYVVPFALFNDDYTNAKTGTEVEVEDRDSTPANNTYIRDDLDEFKNLIENAENIGVTAGASTPENIIKNVIEKIEKI